MRVTWAFVSRGEGGSSRALHHSGTRPVDVPASAEPATAKRDDDGRDEGAAHQAVSLARGVRFLGVPDCRWARGGR